MAKEKGTASAPQIPDALIQAQRIANITDTAVRIPVVGIRLGLDFLIGLIPVLGDLITGLMAFKIILLARKMAVPKQLQKVMLRNMLLDILLGFVPILGDIVDIFFKANKANVRIMEKWWVQKNASALKHSTRQQLERWEDDNGPAD